MHKASMTRRLWLEIYSCKICTTMEYKQLHDKTFRVTGLNYITSRRH